MLDRDNLTTEQEEAVDALTDALTDAFHAFGFPLPPELLPHCGDTAETHYRAEVFDASSVEADPMAAQRRGL